MKAVERLYLTADRLCVVGEGNAGAAFLLAPKGGEIPKAYEGQVEAFAKFATVATETPVEASPVSFSVKENAMPTRRRR
jgi:hypothetical protein